MEDYYWNCPYSHTGMDHDCAERIAFLEDASTCEVCRWGRSPLFEKEWIHREIFGTESEQTVRMACPYNDGPWECDCADRIPDINKDVKHCYICVMADGEKAAKWWMTRAEAEKKKALENKD